MSLFFSIFGEGNQCN